MERKEAIKTIKEAESCFCKHGAYKDCHSKCKFKDALDLAIASLETDEAYQLEYEYEKAKALFGKVVKEEDCISRAEVLKLMKDNWHTHNGDWAMQESMDDIRALPSVYPKSDAIPRERIEQMKNEFIHIGKGSGWLDISLSHCLEIIDYYTKEQTNGKE